MTDKAILSAVYTEWRMVKTRNALVLCFEVPLEHQELVQKVLGTPLQGTSTHVAIARLIDPAGRENVKEPEALPAPTRPLTLAAKAGILCLDVRFQKFAAEQGWDGLDDGLGVATPRGAAIRMVYEYCGVSSRRDLDTDQGAADRFRALQAEFDVWCKT